MTFLIHKSNKSLNKAFFCIFVLALTFIIVIASKIDSKSPDSWCIVFIPLWFLLGGLILIALTCCSVVIGDKSHDIEDQLKLCFLVTFVILILGFLVAGASLLCQRLDYDFPGGDLEPIPAPDELDYSTILTLFLIAEIGLIIPIIFQERFLR